MSIHIEAVTKHFGTQVAVGDLSFSVEKGEIVGFLGPNGAGKSTTMKILTGYLAPDTGKVSVAGFNVLKDPLTARRHIGYLPEHNPLYLDMYVLEFLKFIGELHGLSNIHARTNEVIALVGLSPEKTKRIGQLSKGYRQRVGLAQALLHDPAVLILDEPTTGLDPNQLSEIREVIRTIGQEKTVILSTHIMQEVEAVCSRVLILNKGKLVSDAPIAAYDDLEKTFRELTA